MYKKTVLRTEQKHQRLTSVQQCCGHTRQVLISYHPELLPSRGGGATVLKGAVSNPRSSFCIHGGHKTEHREIFIIVIMTSKRLPAANKIT